MEVPPGRQSVDAPRGQGRDSVPAAVWLLPFGLLVVALVAVPLHIFDEQGWPRYRRMTEELATIEHDNQRLTREVKDLQRDVEALRTDPRAVERIARDELGMVKPGEVIFQLTP